MPQTTLRLDSDTPTTTHTNDVAALYRAFGPIIFARCRRVLRDEALAVEATQEVFVQAVASLRAEGARGAVDVLSRTCEAVCKGLTRAAPIAPSRVAP